MNTFLTLTLVEFARCLVDRVLISWGNFEIDNIFFKTHLPTPIRNTLPTLTPILG